LGDRFNGKVAVVTDVTGPVASVVAALLGEEGASIVVNDPGLGTPGASTSGSVAEEVRLSGAEAIAAREDVTTMAGAEALIATAVDAYGRIDVLVNSAGLRVDGPLHEMTPDDFDRVVSTNVKATFAPTRFAAVRFRQQRSGRIVNLTSDAGLGEAGASGLSAASEAVVGMTRTVARDLGKYGVTCNALCVVDDSESAAALAVLLCTEALPHVNGYSFGVRGGSVYVYSNPAIERSIHKWGAFTLDEMDNQAPDLLVAD
jgi:NAD(P)-dependent dehydrogenase (short-subunit alcohol dehydrogenase family)